MEIAATFKFKDIDLMSLKFADKLPLLLSSLAFMVTGMMMLIVSFRNREAINLNKVASNHYVYMNRGSGRIFNHRKTQSQRIG
jgi:hypothetical protein